MTPANVSYYYPSIFDLYAGAFEVVTEQFVQDRQLRVERVDGPIAKLIECIRLGVPTPGTSSLSAALLVGELAILTNRRVELRASALQFEADQIALFAEILNAGVAAGVFTPVWPVPDAARLLLAGEDGLATAVIAERISPDESVRLLLEHASVITGCELVDHAAGSR